MIPTSLCLRSRAQPARDPRARPSGDSRLTRRRADSTQADTAASESFTPLAQHHLANCTSIQYPASAEPQSSESPTNTRRSSQGAESAAFHARTRNCSVALRGSTSRPPTPATPNPRPTSPPPLPTATDALAPRTPDQAQAQPPTTQPRPSSEPHQRRRIAPLHQRLNRSIRKPLGRELAQSPAAHRHIERLPAVAPPSHLADHTGTFHHRRSSRAQPIQPPLCRRSHATTAQEQILHTFLRITDRAA